VSTPRHHPPAELIVDLARGAVTPGRALIVSAHLGVCPACQRALSVAEAVGGALLETLEPTLMAPDALARTLSKLEAEPPQSPPRSASLRQPGPADWIAAPVAAAEALARKRWAAPGVWTAPVRLPTRAPGRSYLLGIGPGISVPLHTHRGVESLCVLKGSLEDGETLGPGDFRESDEAVVHRPGVTRDSECVCLIWTEHPLVPRSFIGRLMQPFVRI
jgi:putative transcriptional regulator